MVEFLKSYGIWIFPGLLFLFMLRGHAHGGGGCCGGGHQHDQEEPEKKERPARIRKTKLELPLRRWADVVEKSE